MTFDNVPWVVTMKKNDHYFPTMEWIKDPSESSGWRRVTYEKGTPIEGEGHDGIPLVSADTFDDNDPVAGI
jgi:hypothetical protein